MCGIGAGRVNSLLYFQGKALLGRDRARHYLCLEICKKLHTIGELSTEHLQPIKHQKAVMEDEENSGGPKEGTRKNRSFYKRKVC